MPDAFGNEWTDAGFADALERVRLEGVIDARGVSIGSQKLHALLQAAPRSAAHPERGAELKRVDFRGVTFTDDVVFFESTFAEDADFRNATFNHDATFHGAAFAHDADFKGANFKQEADFFDVAFGGKADFSRAIFGRDAQFTNGTCTGSAKFGEATFEQAANFADVTFASDLSFRDAKFIGDARFTDVTFARSANFRNVAFNHDADFSQVVVGDSIDFMDAEFDHARQLGPILVLNEFLMIGAIFSQPVRIRLGAAEAYFGRTVFRGGADVFLRRASVTLGGVDFAAPSLVAEFSPTALPGVLSSDEIMDDGEGWVCRLERDQTKRTHRPGVPTLAPPLPRVLSVRRAKVAQLTLSGLDLRPCRFVGAHGLDEMRLEQARFAYTPSGWEARKPWKWTRRQTIAEEHHSREKEAGWYGPEIRPPDWLDEIDTPPHTLQIAAIYRALRKSLEDDRDEPGAADFYYGEMEMRRRAAKPAQAADEGNARPAVSPGEREVLGLYWLLAGYGLRASRALVALVVVILVASIPLTLWGFHSHEGYGRAVLFASESSISLLRQPTASLSAGGQITEIVLRLAGPLFFGLMLLSLRGRIKR